MKTNKLNFTVKALTELQADPVKSRTYFYDLKVVGLELAITKAGIKTFYIYRWSNTKGGPIRMRLGRFPDLSIEQARKRASELILEVIKGNNPIEDKRERQNRLTVKDIVESYKEWMKVNEREEISQVTYAAFVRRFFSEIKDLPLDSVTTEKIVTLRARIRNKDGKFSPLKDSQDGQRKSDRKVTANRFVRFLSQTFNHAIRTNLWKGQNPCKPIKPFPEPPRTRRLDDCELSLFLSACNELRKIGHKLVVDVLLTALFTGVRRANVTSATWEQFNLLSGTWDIPKTKNGLPQKVFLSPFILNILRERFEERINDFVFPSVGKTGHLKEPKKGLWKVLSLAGIEQNGLTIHALKHTFVSYAYEAAINPIVVAKMGGHKVPGITARYGHASDKAIKEGYEEVAEYMLKIARAYAEKNLVAQPMNTSGEEFKRAS